MQAIPFSVALATLAAIMAVFVLGAAYRATTTKRSRRDTRHAGAHPNLYGGDASNGDPSCDGAGDGGGCDGGGD